MKAALQLITVASQHQYVKCLHCVFIINLDFVLTNKNVSALYETFLAGQQKVKNIFVLLVIVSQLGLLMYTSFQMKTSDAMGFLQMMHIVTPEAISMYCDILKNNQKYDKVCHAPPTPQQKQYYYEIFNGHSPCVTVRLIILQRQETKVSVIKNLKHIPTCSDEVLQAVAVVASDADEVYV